VDALAKISKRIPVIWSPQTFLNGSTLAWQNSNAQINLYVEGFNAVARSLLSESKVHIWHSYEQIVEFFRELPDGIHLGPLMKHLAVEILLNFLCRDSP
jgi:hypothetical protein